ncbi:DUF222 domain-containing protein [Actinomycetospora lutea]|uniref:HNH endonuclease signature motif containing protein n=1 Tax=Actinomycetospora lutea TaxID=663604 RepID=UPI0023652380|nr:HNH endonuclease signature motif containing protein [Actinomycetospora lutea]MDD7940349.1 DUF222 domain-containing protein [Actinomycetospora lutea]
MSIEHDLEAGLAAVLDDREPDADLVGVLDDIDPTMLTGEALASYVRARWRVHNRAEAQLLTGLREMGTAQDGRTTRLGSADEFSGDEVAAVLGWSRAMASRRLGLADDLFARLPALGAALWQGWLDEPKVRAISETVADLCDDHAQHATLEVLPEAAQLPVGALRDRVEEIAIALDPDWADRRRQRAEARGRVLLTANPSGTATLSFIDAPGQEGIDSESRIETLAAAVRRLGVLTPIGKLRMQVGMRLLDGSTEGMTDRDIAVLLATEYHAADDPDGPDDEGRGDGPDDDGPDDGGPNDDGPDAGGPDRGRGAAADRAAVGSDAAPTLPAPRSPAEQGALDLPDLPDPSDHDEPDDTESRALETSERRAGRVRQGTVEVRLRLTTALGLDQHPATVPGYGTVTAPLARHLVARRHHGEWRVVLTTPDGHLHHVLLARRRPPRPRTRGRAPGAARTGAIVELQVPTTMLAALDPDDHPAWAPLLRELQQRLADLVATGQLGRPPDADTGPDRWARRRAGAEAERWVRARDRTCVAPWCGRPAHRAEIDHTHDHARGGATLTWNLGAWCTHDHRAKHQAGWTVRQPRPGHFVIRTRAGITHSTGPKRILRLLPHPRPAAEPRPLPYDGWPDTTSEDDDADRLAEIGPEPAAGPRTTTAPPREPPPVDDLDDPPPF